LPVALPHQSPDLCGTNLHFGSGGVDLAHLLATTLGESASRLEQARIDALARQAAGRGIEIVKQ
jgi:hypothetical protein